jgi:hypothetical protein
MPLLIQAYDSHLSIGNQDRQYAQETTTVLSQTNICCTHASILDIEDLPKIDVPL